MAHGGQPEPLVHNNFLKKLLFFPFKIVKLYDILRTPPSFSLLDLGLASQDDRLVG